MERDNQSFQDAFTHQIATRDAFSHQIWNFYLKEYKRSAPDKLILKTRSEVRVKVILTRKWYVTLRHPRMHFHTKFGIPTSKNIGDMHQTQSSFQKLGQGSRSMSQGPKDGALCHLKTHPNTKFVIPSLNDIGDMLRTRLFWKLDQGQGHSYLKILRDTLLSQYASTHQI